MQELLGAEEALTQLENSQTPKEAQDKLENVIQAIRQCHTEDVPKYFARLIDLYSNKKRIFSQIRKRSK